jgi:protein farnesyltransferase subunit beta
MQNTTGGFGGGFGQYSHLAGTYAGLLSLALVGGDDAYSLVDREKMWYWLGRLKQPDGGFQLCEGGEEDVRGAYCALVAISLLDLPLSLPPGSPARDAGLETFMDGLGEYLSRCQTYEGGIAASPGNEAHGAFAFCVMACLCLYDQPHFAINKFLDVDAFICWLSSRQYGPEGGLAGRTNKLVDGCYSHWLGECWPMVQAALSGPRGSVNEMAEQIRQNLYSSEGLARYILCCCQCPTGGLRDKPSKSAFQSSSVHNFMLTRISRRPDSYHSCYTLCGVSLVEHLHSYGQVTGSEPFASAFSWEASEARIPSEGDPSEIFNAGAGLKAVHPVYAIPHHAVHNMRAWSVSRPLNLSQA